MEAKKISVLFVSVCLFFVLAIIPSMGFSAPPKPSTIILGTHDLGTGGNRLLALCLESMISKYPEIKWRTIPSGVDLARTMMPRTGETVTTIHTGGSVWLIQEGLSSYAEIQWGPQPIREIYLPEHVGQGFAVKGNSSIKTGHDLKGKTVGIYPGSPYPTLINESILAFFNLTWKDVKPVKMSSPPEGYRAIRDGHVDTAFMNAASSIAVEMASMPSGIRWINMPASNKEGWARARKVVPVHMPKRKTHGPGISEKNPIEIMTVAYPEIIAYDKSDKVSVYWITRALIETRDSWEKKHYSLKADWTMDKHWGLWEGGITPMHDGAIEYYKEIGQWNDKREKLNQKRIQHQKELRAYFEEVRDMAQKEKVKAKVFAKYWLKKYHAKYGK